MAALRERRHPPAGRCLLLDPGQPGSPLPWSRIPPARLGGSTSLRVAVTVSRRACGLAGGTEVRPEHAEGLRAGIDPRVRNPGIERYRLAGPDSDGVLFPEPELRLPRQHQDGPPTSVRLPPNLPHKMIFHASRAAHRDGPGRWPPADPRCHGSSRRRRSPRRRRDQQDGQGQGQSVMMTRRAPFPGSDLAGVGTRHDHAQGPCPRSYHLSPARRLRHPEDFAGALPPTPP